MKRWKKIILGSLGVIGLFGLGVIINVQTHDVDKISYTIAGLDKAPIALILGAGIQPQGTPSDALRDRLLVGIELLQDHKVDSLLITGDDGRYHQDEISSMRNFLLDHGVASGSIQEDGEGYRTYESCKRAIEKGIYKAIIVTQRFHLSRALYLCNQLGMNAQGIPADLTTYQRIIYFTLRDLAASFKAWWDINIITPKSPI